MWLFLHANSGNLMPELLEKAPAGITLLFKMNLARYKIMKIIINIS